MLSFYPQLFTDRLLAMLDFSAQVLVEIEDKPAVEGGPLMLAFSFHSTINPPLTLSHIRNRFFKFCTHPEMGLRVEKLFADRTSGEYEVLMNPEDFPVLCKHIGYDKPMPILDYPFGPVLHSCSNEVRVYDRSTFRWSKEICKGHEFRLRTNNGSTKAFCAMCGEELPLEFIFKPKEV